MRLYMDKDVSDIGTFPPQKTTSDHFIKRGEKNSCGEAIEGGTNGKTWSSLIEEHVQDLKTAKDILCRIKKSFKSISSLSQTERRALDIYEKEKGEIVGRIHALLGVLANLQGTAFTEGDNVKDQQSAEDEAKNENKNNTESNSEPSPEPQTFPVASNTISVRESEVRKHNEEKIAKQKIAKARPEMLSKIPQLLAGWNAGETQHLDPLVVDRESMRAHRFCPMLAHEEIRSQNEPREEDTPPTTTTTFKITIKAVQDKYQVLPPINSASQTEPETEQDMEASSRLRFDEDDIESCINVDGGQRETTLYERTLQRLHERHFLLHPSTPKSLYRGSQNSD